MTISDQQGKFFPFTLNQLSFIPDANKFHPFSLKTQCSTECNLLIQIDGQGKFKLPIPEGDQVFKQQQAVVPGNLQVFFEKVVSGGRKYTAVIGVGERATHNVRRVLFDFYQSILPGLLYLGLIAFAVLTVVAIKQRDFSVLFVLNAAVWGAMLARLTILFLVHISSFPALNVMYFMPVYSLLLIASVISLYLLIQLLRNYFQARKNQLNTVLSTNGCNTKKLQY